MIRRGLQILSLVGITALGAAPSYGQPGTTNWPTFVVLQDFANNSLNGAYSVVGTTAPDGWYIMQRYSANNSLIYWITLQDDTRAGLGNLVNVHTNYPTTSSTARLLTLAVGSAMWPASLTRTDWQEYNSAGGFVANRTGTIVFNWGTPPPPDPYAQNFPDWAKARTLIPLGFGFAMAFWAAAVALSIGMRWVRDLASVAT